MTVDYRSNDAVITICQNNKAKLINISEINEAAIEVTGFRPSEIIGRPLSMVLPKRIGELLTEYVEFESNANDVGAVLSKVQSFSIVDRDGTETAYKIKVVRQSSTDNLLFFSIVLHNALGARKNEAIRKIIQDNFKGHESLDLQTDLPDRSSLVKDIGVMKRFNVSNQIISCFAVLQVDNYDGLLAKYGRDVFLEVFKHIAFVTRRSLRPDDVVGVVGDGRIGILLVDIMNGSERIVLNRLRWQIASNPYVDASKNSIGLSVSIGFCYVSANYSDRQNIEICETALDSLGSKAQNMVVEASS